MTDYLLDTDTCVELIRGRSRKALTHLRGCPMGTVGISSITLAELQYGADKSADPLRNRVLLAQFCAPLEILPFEGKAASAYGKVRSKLEKKGTPIGSLDNLIAAHALALSAVLVTNNVREFRRIEGLQVENWVKS